MLMVSHQLLTRGTTGTVVRQFVCVHVHVCQNLLCSALEVSVSVLWPLVSMKLYGFLFYSADVICIYAVGGLIWLSLPKSPN